MQRTIAAMALCGCLACASAGAQAPPTAARPPGSTPAPNADGAARASVPAGGAGPAVPGDHKADPARPNPTVRGEDRLNPYLLTAQHGPFLVVARVFRGPDAEEMALALCKELRAEHDLPARILRPGDLARARQAPREPARVHDEVAVIVGDEKTIQESEELLKKVRKIEPKCLQATTRVFPWRKSGLGRAVQTTNPYLTSQ